jgi:hypothetical protein
MTRVGELPPVLELAAALELAPVLELPPAIELAPAVGLAASGKVARARRLTLRGVWDVVSPAGDIGATSAEVTVAGAKAAVVIAAVGIAGTRPVAIILRPAARTGRPRITRARDGLAFTGRPAQRLRR